jgi:hypothetical protein
LAPSTAPLTPSAGPLLSSDIKSSSWLTCFTVWSPGRLLDRVGRGQNRVICLIAPQVGAFPRCGALKPLRAPKTSATRCDGVPSLVDGLPWVAVTPPTLPALAKQPQPQCRTALLVAAGLLTVFRAILRSGPTGRATIAGEDMQPGNPGRVNTGHEAGWTKLLGE